MYLRIKEKSPNKSDFLVGEDGFEPSKRNATDLQSAPFGHSGTLPNITGAGGRTRTPDLLITNQLLYQLSYTSISTCERLSLVSTLEYNTTAELICQAFFSIFFSFFLLIFYLWKKSLSAQLKEAEPPLDVNGSASWRLF